MIAETSETRCYEAAMIIASALEKSKSGGTLQNPGDRVDPNIALAILAGDILRLQEELREARCQIVKSVAFHGRSDD